MKKGFKKVSCLLSIVAILSPLGSNLALANENLNNVSEPEIVEVDLESEEIIPISDINNNTTIFDDLAIPDNNKTRGATGYTYKGHTVVSSKTYKNKKLKNLKTSRVWSTAANSSRPTISVTVSRTNSISATLSNGSNNFNWSQNVSFATSESYTEQPKAKGYKVSIGIYAKKVVAKKIRIAAYSKATGKFSHYIYSNRAEISGVYVGKSHTKG